MGFWALFWTPILGPSPRPPIWGTPGSGVPGYGVYGLAGIPHIGVSQLAHEPNSIHMATSHMTMTSDHVYSELDCKENVALLA